MEDEIINPEFYTIDFNGEVIIYGGITHEIFIKDLKTKEILTSFEDFTDSVVFLKFFSKNDFYAVSLKGEVAIYNLDEGLKEIVLLEDEITSHTFTKNTFTKNTFTKNSEKDKNLVLGSESGVVYNFFDGIKYKCYYAHNTEIYQAEFFEDQIFSLSSEKFVIFDSKTTENLYTKSSYLLTNFFIISKSVFILGSEKNTRIFKNDRLIKNINCLFSSYLKTQDGVLCGGEKLIEIGFKEFNLFDYEISEQIIFMKSRGFDIFISDGKKLGFGDLRGQIEFVDLNVGQIFDFIIAEKEVCFVGEEGLSILEL